MILGLDRNSIWKPVQYMAKVVLAIAPVIYAFVMWPKLSIVMVQFECSGSSGSNNLQIYLLAHFPQAHETSQVVVALQVCSPFIHYLACIIFLAKLYLAVYLINVAFLLII
jgi:hypothetical protein